LNNVTPSGQIEVADWITSVIHPFSCDVGSLVPEGFAAYARIFHRSASGDTWAEVAKAHGKVAHPLMQFDAISGSTLVDWDYKDSPRDGRIDRVQMPALIDVLRRYTASPTDCWFCLWEGFGYVVGGTAVAHLTKSGSPTAGPVQRASAFRLSERVELPGRKYLLFRGSIESALDWWDGPNLWWPEDHAWCVATEIDLPYSYIGGSRALIDALLSTRDIEAADASFSDKITADSDTVNAG
jgi:hypothetical protein